MRAQIVLNTWESKALIAKGLADHPMIELSLEEGTIAVGRGLTNAFVLKELLAKTGQNDFKVDLDNYVAGIIDGTLWLSDGASRTPEVVFKKGVASFQPIAEVVKEMGDGPDLIIKGGNALGTDGIAGVLCAHPEGGTIGAVYGIAMARGIPIVVPIGCEKLVPHQLASLTMEVGGNRGVDYVTGIPVGLYPMTGAEVFTEVDAFQMLADVDVYQIGAGGVYDGAGSVIFELFGSDEDMEEIIAVVEAVKGTEPLKTKLKPHD